MVLDICQMFEEKKLKGQSPPKSPKVRGKGRNKSTRKTKVKRMAADFWTTQLFSRLTSGERIVIMERMIDKKLSVAQAKKKIIRLKYMHQIRGTLVEQLNAKNWSELLKAHPNQLGNERLNALTTTYIDSGTKLRSGSQSLRGVNRTKKDCIKQLYTRLMKEPGCVQQLLVQLKGAAKASEVDEDTFEWVTFEHPVLKVTLKVLVKKADAFAADLVLPKKPYRVAMVSYPFGLDRYHSTDDLKDDHLASAEEIDQWLSNIVRFNSAQVWSLFEISSFEHRQMLDERAAQRFKAGTDHVVICKTGKATHGGKNNYHCNIEAACIHYHGQKRSEEHFRGRKGRGQDLPGEPDSSLGVPLIYNGSCITVPSVNNKFKMDGTVANTAQHAAGVAAYFLRHQSKVKDYGLFGFCGSGTDVIVALIFGLNVVAFDIRQSQVDATLERISRLRVSRCLFQR